MSLTNSLDQRSIARQTQSILKGASAAFTGRQRGPDHAEPEEKRRVPRRNSYEQSDPRANPWTRMGDGSAGQGIAYREALIRTAEEACHEGWRTYPLREIRDRRREHQALSAELESLQAMSPAEVPIGRPATIRRELGRLDAWLKPAEERLRRIDVDVLKALLQFVDFATGRLFPSLEEIARRAGCHKNSVVKALNRLKLHGFLSWVRRTIRTGNEGEFGPQLEQTSNAYYFEHRQRMAPRVWQRYWQLLCAKLRRLGKRPPQVAPAVPHAARMGVGGAVAAFGASIDHAST
ncbi:helix-turn-helix domain-containing protein [Sphingomonas sp. ABOLF]|uniref:helix-turn-helix domain-containing protein n=1 Tax=Sphingomonas sp. ABOLF TaxID=1985879 RepID=UPI000F7E9C96|nr:helix-turn-helix domain-containing protein [Sphingomonas sp. ABOLF]RSV15211.1 helix-turn-helix domain-containing protein [Sphingomonas sp. ABOLF]